MFFSLTLTKTSQSQPRRPGSSLGSSHSSDFCTRSSSQASVRSHPPTSFPAPAPSSASSCLMPMCVCVCVCVCIPHLIHPSPLYTLYLVTPWPPYTNHIHSERWIWEGAYADPRGKLRALWEGNCEVPNPQSTVKKGSAGSRWAHALDSIEHRRCGKGTARGEPEWSRLRLGAHGRSPPRPGPRAVLDAGKQTGSYASCFQ